MKKILIILSILIVLGSLGGFLFDGVASVEVSEQDFPKTLEPVSSYSCEREPGYPDDCNPL